MSGTHFGSAAQQTNVSYRFCKKKCIIGFEKHQKRILKYRYIRKLILTTMISANIGLKWYYWVYVTGYFIDFVFVQNKYKKKVKLSYLYL